MLTHGFDNRGAKSGPSTVQLDLCSVSQRHAEKTYTYFLFNSIPLLDISSSASSSSSSSQTRQLQSLKANLTLPHSHTSNPPTTHQTPKMTAPSVDPTTAVFFQKKEFSGPGDIYTIGQDLSLPGALNDKYLSVAIGTSAKVIAWQHYNESGHYAEWTSSQSDISAIGGLSRFRVVDDSTRVISFLFKDGTGGEARQYSLKVDARDVGSVVLFSGAGLGGEEGKEEYAMVGVMPEGGPPVTTAVYVRDEKSGVYVAVGSVFFQWNEQRKEVDVVENENWPKQLVAKRTGSSRFEVTLVSNEPST